MKILFKYATRSRRDNFLRGIDSIKNNVASQDYHVLIAVDHDDDKMRPLPVLDIPHTYVVAHSNSKVHAINRNIDTVQDWDVLVCMSDDMVFNVKGFDDTIRGAFYVHEGWPPNLDQFIHFPDGNRKDLATMSIMGRDYYERDKYIYHPDYVSLFCDNEAQEVAKMRGCYKFVDTHIFNHLHPAYGKGVFDVQYQYTESFGAVDHATYLKRKEANFA